ncbi:hypothetical protein ACFLEY_05265 [Bradyrhizobium sp. YCK136]|uniref:hypothetical protein n=1 Tax=Bradyrhizobium TaxID=374 RepID=UPI001B8C5E9C|nr:hypothetical protein [Bradyrhizobium diazoefficiens]MBR0864567.1 hypothetical protein [Bradyrhizobium diazoefficiens]MBR0889142.1 hypothetical protein [Bradyrhizobium diazoefficiens]MBR0920892.1 hypothetical protein [Bradyrhizobium diazoefficiens]
MEAGVSVLRVAESLKSDVSPDKSILPASLAYPEAWQAYVKFKAKSAPTPPAWFVTEFLERLGFDKRIANLE